jgi:hypothetical protein
MIVSALAHILRWLLAGFLGRIILSVFMQGIVVAGALFYGGAMADWAVGKMYQFVRASQFWERLNLAFAGLGDLPEYALQMLGCIGAHEALVALISGQISGVGLALICRKLL